MLIGELAEISAVSRDTLRHYERKGVMPPSVRSPKGYRLYSSESVERVKLVRRALAVGFTLDEIARIFAERERGNVPCREVYALAADKLESVKVRLREMEILRDELENLVFEWNKKLENVAEGEPVHLFKSLAKSSENGFENRSRAIGENLHPKKRKGKLKDD